MRFKLPDALPSLEGARGRIVRAAYVVLALIAAAVIAGSLLFNGLDFFRNMPNAANYGFMTYTSPQMRVTIGETWPHAVSRGLARRDLLLAIDGRPLGPGATEFDAGAAIGRAGDRVTLLVERNGTRHSITLDRQPERWTPVISALNIPLWLYAGSSYFAANFHTLFLFAASLLLFLRRPRDPEAMLFAFGFLLLCARTDFTWWMEPVLGVGGPARNLVSNFGWLACMIAFTGFPDGRFVTRLSRVSLLLNILGFAAPVYWMDGNSSIMPWIFYSLLALAILSTLLRWHGTADRTTRQQMKWAVTGFCVMAIMMLGLSSPVTDALYAVGQPFGFFVTRAIAVVGYVALPLGLLVSLLRYRLYDAEAAIGRSAVFAVLTLGLLGVFAGTEKIIEALGEEYFGGSIGALAGGIAAALAAVLIVPMHHRVERWADRNFRGDLLKLRRDLPALVGDLRETADAAAIGDAVAVRVMQGMRAQRVAVVTEGEAIGMRSVTPAELAEWCRGWLPAEGEGIALEPKDRLLPVRVPLEADGCGRVGWLLLGPRPDGSLYGKDERHALAEIADPIARALQIVRRREERQEATQDRMAAIERRFAALEAAFARLGGAAPA